MCNSEVASPKATVGKTGGVLRLSKCCSLPDKNVLENSRKNFLENFHKYNFDSKHQKISKYIK